MNLSEQLKNALNPNFLKIIELSGKNADLYGVNAYIIGGVVRDLLLKEPIYDIDIVIEGNAIDFCNFLQENKICQIIRTAKNFGTTKIKFNTIDDFIIDFASTRTEIYPKAGHLPVIEKIGCSLKEDILRRDFSVNSLAININSSKFGELIDYTGGLEDIEKKELKILHEKSFIDDPTRIIRGLRFCHKLGFKLEKNTQRLQNEYLSKFDNNDICYERIKQVIKLAFNLNSAELFDDFIEKNIYKLLCQKTRQIKGQTLFKIINKNKKYVSNENIWLIYLSAILTPNDLSKFNLSAKETLIIESIDEYLKISPKLCSNFDIYNFFKNKPLEATITCCLFDKKTKAQKFLNELINIKPILTGKDLLSMGFSTGQIIGEILLFIIKEKLDGKLQTKEEEINFAMQFLNIK